jgi:hypothetical protein
MPIGFYKKPETMTYYAIRLKAKVRLPFSPFGEVTLKAYAAAKPFGSRIGPKLEDNKDWVREGVKPKNDYGLANKLVGVPNLPIGAEDSVGRGWRASLTVLLHEILDGLGFDKGHVAV